MAMMTNKKDIGSWQEVFEFTCSERVKMMKERAVQTPQVCLEHAMIEMEVYDDKDIMALPRILQRAKLFERYLQKRTIFIADGELIVGNVNSKQRASTIVGELYNEYFIQELDHPTMDPQVRKHDRHIISEEEREVIRKKIIPYFKGKTLEEYLFSKADGEVKERGFSATSSCPHMPNYADLLVRQDAGHTLANYEKVLHIGLKGIRDEIVYAKEKAEAPYNKFGRKKKLEFYEAALICIDACIAHAKRYADLAKTMAKNESDSVRKAELEKIAAVCEVVPANPATNWWEACQSFWFTHLFILLEQINYGDSFGRFDQYMYPYYKKSVEDEKIMSRDEALELLECLFIKTAEYTQLYDYNNALVQTGFPLGQNMILGGQKRDGTDACNDLTLLCLEADEQVALIQPDIAFRLWEGTPDKYIRKVAEVIRLGRGKPKVYGDKVGLEIEAKAYPEYSIEDHRDYAVIGCEELALPHISQAHSFTALQNIAKILDLTLHNGVCSYCGKQMGPATGDPRKFESIESLKIAFREQVFFWFEHLARAVAVEMDAQAERMPLPYTSTLLEGPIQKGLDVMEGGAWKTAYGCLVIGVINTGDSLAAIDTLIYKDKKLTWDQLLKAIDANWEGYEDIRQLCINGAPKFGNDNDYADSWSAFVLNTWIDAVDYCNARKDILPKYGGSYHAGGIIGNGPVAMGVGVSALPDGRFAGAPLADTLSPTQGRDVKGTTAVMLSESKLPHSRCTLGTCINQRLHPQLLATKKDIDNFIAYLRTVEQLGTFLTQYNVISSDLLRKAMKEPEKHANIMVRVASYCSYFTELDEATQNDIINRTEQTEW